MGLITSFSEFFLAFCVFGFIQCGPLNPKKEKDMTTPSTEVIPWPARVLFSKFMDSLETITCDKNSDISFHKLERVSDEYEFDISEIVADLSVTGVDLGWHSPSPKDSCHITLDTNEIKLQGKRSINGFIFHDFDDLLYRELSSNLLRVRAVGCSVDDPPSYVFVVVYRNISKERVFQELDNARVSRIKRDAKTRGSNPTKKETSLGVNDSGCGLVPWTVDFVRLNWDRYIIAPLKYEANSCQGRCVSKEKCLLKMTNKTLKNYDFVREIYGNLCEPQPEQTCCQPSKYGSLVMLFSSKSSVILRSVLNMRVVECECYSSN